MASTTIGSSGVTFPDATTQATAAVNPAANVTSATAVAGTGISVTEVTTTGAATHTVTNTGVTSAVAGTNISVSGATGAVTISSSSYPLTSGTAVASTSGTSIDFTSIPSWVKRITVMFNGVSTNGSSAMQVQIGAGSITTSGYNAGSYTNTNKSVTTTGFQTDNGAAIFTRSGLMTIDNMNSNIWVASGSWACQPDSDISYFAGGVTLGGTLDRVRITTSNGTDTFDAGSINILYE